MFTVTKHRTAKPVTASDYTGYKVPKKTRKRTGVNTDELKSNYKDQNRRSQHATYIAHKLKKKKANTKQEVGSLSFSYVR